MDKSQSTVFTLVYISWGLISVVLVVLLSYRATLLRDDDRNVMNTPGLDHFQSQKTFIARKSRLTREIIVLSVISGLLLLTCVGFSLIQVGS
jgi:hypothetical protein